MKDIFLLLAPSYSVNVLIQNILKCFFPNQKMPKTLHFRRKIVLLVKFRLSIKKLTFDLVHVFNERL